MITESELRDQLKNFVKQKMPTVIFKVKSVDENNNTCTLVNDDGLEYYDVRLTATVTGSVGMIFYPKVNTLVLAVYIENTNNLHIVHANEYAKVRINCQDIEFNGGSYDGLVKIRKLEDNLDLIKQRFTALETAIQIGLKATVSNGGSIASDVFKKTMDSLPMNFQNMENTKIKH